MAGVYILKILECAVCLPPVTYIFYVVYWLNVLNCGHVLSARAREADKTTRLSKVNLPYKQWSYVKSKLKDIIWA